MNWAAYLPPNVAFTYSNSKPIAATVTFVSDIDASDEDLMPANDTSSMERNERTRTVINKSSESCADFSKKVIMGSISFLEEMRKQVAKFGQNVDLVFHFGDGSISRVYIRYSNCNSLNKSPLVTMELCICLKTMRHGRSYILEPNDNFYQHCLFASENKQEFYVYPSRKIWNPSYKLFDKNGCDTTNLLIVYEGEKISRICSNVNQKLLSNLGKSRINKNSLNKRAPLRRSKRNTHKEKSSPQDDTLADRMCEMDKNNNAILKVNELASESIESTCTDEESVIESPVRTAIKTPRAISDHTNDQNETKRLLSPFILFCNDKRTEILKENPRIEANQLMKRLGKLWREAETELKAKYSDQSKRVSLEVSEKVGVYRRIKIADVQSENDGSLSESLPDRRISVKKRNNENNTRVSIDSKKVKKDPDKPKRPPSAFMLFSHAFRKKNPDIAPNKVFKAIAEAWKKVTLDNKKLYEEQAKTEKEKWKKAMAAYKINSRIKS